MKTKIANIIAAIEQFAPLNDQQSWDNSGMQVGDFDATAGAALLTLDVTMQSVIRAKELGCELIVSHHPLIFNPIKSVTNHNPTGSIIRQAILNGISIYACHTNIDVAHEGVSWQIARKLELRDIKPLEMISTDEPLKGMGCIGMLDTPRDSTELLQSLGVKGIRVSNCPPRLVRRVAVMGGSGASEIDHAISQGAEMLLTGDLRYHDFQKAANHLILADIGHFESEVDILEIISKIIRKKIPTFVLHTQKINFVNHL